MADDRTTPVKRKFKIKQSMLSIVFEKITKYEEFTLVKPNVRFRIK